MTAETINVLLVDDHEMVLEGLAALVAKDPSMRVVGQCSDATKVMEQARLARPHVIVLDIHMPGINGLDLCRELTRKFKQTAVVMLTMNDDHEFMARALKYGARGYVVKGSPVGELLQAIRAVSSGQRHLPPGVAPDSLDRNGHSDEDPFDRLTPRERQVFQMIADGKKSRQIAEELELSPKTVSTHRSSLMEKLKIHSVGELVKLAVGRGNVRLP
jgi:DNA-binding NarL/FixJ family response regulator